MEKKIVIGALVGLLTATLLYVLTSDDFSKPQKTVLTLFIIFPPLHWLGILAVLYYNNNYTKTGKDIIQTKKEFEKINKNKLTLLELKRKGILTEEEYNQKVEKLKIEENEKELKNTQEYKQLKNLLENKIITKEEFESKIKHIHSSKTVDILLIRKAVRENLSKTDLDIIRDNYNFMILDINRNLRIRSIRDKLEEVFKIKTTLGDSELIDIVINELQQLYE